MKETHLFGAANSTQGFYSHFDSLFSSKFQRVYILKGGPGTGKSTFINKCAKEFQCPVEKYHCTAVADSLDGLVVPSYNLSFVDGTHPHRVDAFLPGAVHQTIDLASCWDQTALSQHRVEIEKLFKEGSKCYSSAYRWLKLAGDLVSLGEEDESESLANYHTETALKKIRELIPYFSPLSSSKKAYATALTSQGPINFLPLLDAKVKIVITGDNKRVAQKITAEVVRIFRVRRLPAIYLYCGFQPQRLEHLYIPGDFALISSHQPHFAPKADYTIETESIVQQGILNQVDNYIAKAIEKMAIAAKIHAELESYYIPHMAFSKVDLMLEQTLQEIRAFKTMTKGN